MLSLDEFTRALPMPVKGVGRRGVRLVDPLLIWRYRRHTGDNRPVPPVTLRLAIGAGTSVAHYFESGERTAREVVQALAADGRCLASAGRVLDLGCGCGRIAQSLHRMAGSSTGLVLDGCDVNDLAIGWASANLAGQCRVNDFHPPLPYPNQQFDVVLAVSVFTHLDEGLQDSWLEEVRRILKPDGLALLSVGGQTLLDQINQPGSAMNSRDCTLRLRSYSSVPHDQILFEPYLHSWANSDGLRGTQDGYGMAFHGPDYVRKHWSSWFRVQEILPGRFNGAQDLVLARPVSL